MIKENQPSIKKIKDLLPSKQNLNQIFKKNQIILAYLFGSQAKGLSHQESDIDIGVLFDKTIALKDYLRREGELIGYLAEIFPNQEINIVTLNIASPLLKQAVILEGKLLYTKNKLIQILFQIQTLHEYEEYLHLSNIYNQFLDLKLKNL